MKRLRSVSILSRMLKQIDKRSIHELERSNPKVVWARLQEQGHSRITLDFDESVLSTGRRAEGTPVGFNRKKKGQRTYYPLVCTVAQTREVMAVLHRSGSVHDSHGAIEFMRQWVQVVRQALPLAKVETRMDSAFFSNDMVEALECLNVEYTLSVPLERLVAFQEMIEDRRIWWQLTAGEMKLGYFEKRWKAKSWHSKSRFPFISTDVHQQRQGVLQLDFFEPSERGYSIKVAVTNNRCGARQVVRLHQGRGAQQSIFGELKSHGQMRYIPPRRCNDNQVYLMANLLAHNFTHARQMERT